MDTFPNNPPRKKRDIPYHLSSAKGLTTIHTAGVEVTPFIIHKKWNDEKKKPLRKGLWQITHLFTGKGIGVAGSYKFCKAVAEALLDEPLLYLPCETMWVNHPDVPRVGRKLERLKEQHEALGRW
jgi:hypothetical protein